MSKVELKICGTQYDHNGDGYNFFEIRCLDDYSKTSSYRNPGPIASIEVYDLQAKNQIGGPGAFHFEPDFRGIDEAVTEFVARYPEDEIFVVKSFKFIRLEEKFRKLEVQHAN